MLLVLWLFATPAAYSQTTLWLRYGGPDSRFSITDASQSNPITITAPGHDFRNGETVWISMVRGNLSANGVRKVKNASGNTFQITDLEDRDVAASGRYDGIGFVGRAQATTLAPSPRIVLDGPNGALTARVKDPDGPGGGRAPATNGNVAYDALRNRYRARVSSAETRYAVGDVTNGEAPFAVALGWFMENQNTDFLEAARLWLNNVEHSLAYQANTPFFGTCSEGVGGCGSAAGSNLDWGSFWAANWALGYNMIREQLAPAERQAFAEKMLNGLVGSSCSNRLQTGAGTVTLEQGSNVVTGQGTQFTAIASPDNRWFHVRGGRSYGTWLRIESVVSDTELRLKTPSTISVSGDPWWWEDDWKSNSCGFLWYVSHHAYTPAVFTREAQTTLTAPTGPGDTELRVVNGAAFPQSVPFYAKLSTADWVKVVRIEGDVLTVERGQFFTAPGPAPNGSVLHSTDFPPTGGMGSVVPTTPVPFDSSYHNLTFAKTYGFLITGLALADDDPRAARLAETAWNYWYDFLYPHSKDLWTGITHGGHAYGPPRWQNWTYTLATIGLTTFSPQIDIRDGNWLKKALAYPVFGTLPWNSKKAAMYADSGTTDGIFSRWYSHIYMGHYLFGDTPEFSFGNYWLREKNKWFTAAEMQSGNGYNSIPYALIYAPPGSGCPNERTGELCANAETSIDPHYFFTESDRELPGVPEKAFNIVVSRQNWKPDSTYVWMQAISSPADHIGIYPTPGSYKIGKKDWLLAGGPFTLDGVKPEYGNYIEVDGPTGIALPASNVKNNLGVQGPIAVVDRKSGNRDYAYWRVNSVNAFTTRAAVLRHFRDFLHLKAGEHDYLVVHDDVATRSEKSKRLRLHYFSDATRGTLTRDGGTITFTRKDARVNTRVLLPDDFGKARNEAATLSSGRSNLDSVVIDDGATMTSEFLVVHRAGSSNEEMPPVSLLREVSEGTVAALIADPQMPRIALFSRNGSVDLTTASLVVPPGSDNVQVAVAGLSPGTYEVSRNGAVERGDLVVSESGSISWMARPGAYLLRQVQATPRPLRIITPSRVPNAQVLAPFFFRLDAMGGNGPFQWKLIGGNLPPGVVLDPIGFLTGTPTGEGEFSFTMAVTDSSRPPLTVQTEFTLAIVPPDPMGFQVVTEALPDAVVGEAYRAELEFSGGEAPYRCALINALPDGLSLSEAGIISGTPVEAGLEIPIEVECRDSSSPELTAMVQLSLTILDVAPTATGGIVVPR